MDVRYYRGDRSVIGNRRKDNIAWLNQVDGLADKLARNSHGDNFALPSDIRYIVPVVCSPSVEPLVSLEEKDMATPSLPRILTPLELVDLLESEDLSTVIANPHVKNVQPEHPSTPIAGDRHRRQKRRR